MNCLGCLGLICTLTIFAPERMLACIRPTLNGLRCVRLSRLLVGFRTHFKSLHFHSFILKRAGFPILTDLLFDIPPSSHQFLNKAWLFGTTAWGTIRQKRLRRSRGEIFAYPVTTSRLCHTDSWRCSARLFQTGATNSADIFFANCLIHLLLPVATPRDTEITSRLEDQPLIV